MSNNWRVKKISEPCAWVIEGSKTAGEGGGGTVSGDSNTRRNTKCGRGSLNRLRKRGDVFVTRTIREGPSKRLRRKREKVGNYSKPKGLCLQISQSYWRQKATQC